MINRFFFFTFLLLICFTATSQVRVKITSSVDGANLSYATISNLSQHTTYSANELGEIGFRVKTGDSLRVTHIGYIGIDYVYSENTTRILKLYPDTSILPPIVLSSCSKYQDVLIKNTGKGKSNPIFIGYTWMFGQEKSQLGFLLKSKYERATLKKFSFWLKDNSDSDSAIFAPWLISIYGVNDSDAMPSKPLYREPIVFFPKKKGKQTVSFDSMKINIPENGLYIMLQYIMDKKYAWKDRFIDSMTHYGVVLEGIINPSFATSYYEPKRDGWLISQWPANGSILFEVGISYCKDAQEK